MRAVFASGLILIAAHSLAQADDCDITKFKDQMSYHKDIMTNLAYINQIASREDRSKQDNADISVMNYGSFLTATRLDLPIVWVVVRYKMVTT